MFLSLGLIQKQLCQGKRLFIAFIDFKKAFNVVNRDLLFWKIIKSGLKGKLINILRSIYKQSHARAKINGVLYDWIEDEGGIHQGRPSSLRRVISRFRLNCHNLEIEKGRHRGVPPEQTFCAVCSDSTYIEIEHQLFMDCSFYTEIRTKYMTIRKYSGLITHSCFNILNL